MDRKETRVQRVVWAMLDLQALLVRKEKGDSQDRVAIKAKLDHLAPMVPTDWTQLKAAGVVKAVQEMMEIEVHKAYLDRRDSPEPMDETEALENKETREILVIADRKGIVVATDRTVPMAKMVKRDPRVIRDPRETLEPGGHAVQMVPRDNQGNQVNQESQVAKGRQDLTAIQEPMVIQDRLDFLEAGVHRDLQVNLVMTEVPEVRDPLVVKVAKVCVVSEAHGVLGENLVLLELLVRQEQMVVQENPVRMVFQENLKFCRVWLPKVLAG